MARLERLPDPPTHTLHLTGTELYALGRALWAGVRDTDTPDNVRAAQAGIMLAMESPTFHERTATLLEDAGAPLPPDGERTWCTLVLGPANGLRVYVTPKDQEVFARPLVDGRKHRYVRNPDNPAVFTHQG
ncbi:hypothetical protein [Nocardiopsis sp. FR26]|uniref:hypothetical protein n=1 Tax=Nocardiopsis sp. FR26 TaxID=2605987 RepID=UPI001359DE9D|nr:hypothetical protein [Nocardiopsis sp. FR26]